MVSSKEYVLACDLFRYALLLVAKIIPRPDLLYFGFSLLVDVSYEVLVTHDHLDTHCNTNDVGIDAKHHEHLVSDL